MYRVVSLVKRVSIDKKCQSIISYRHDIVERKMIGAPSISFHVEEINLMEQSLATNEFQ